MLAPGSNLFGHDDLAFKNFHLFNSHLSSIVSPKPTRIEVMPAVSSSSSSIVDDKHPITAHGLK